MFSAVVDTITLFSMVRLRNYGGWNENTSGAILRDFTTVIFLPRNDKLLPIGPGLLLSTYGQDVYMG